MSGARQLVAILAEESCRLKEIKTDLERLRIPYHTADDFQRLWVWLTESLEAQCVELGHHIQRPMSFIIKAGPSCFGCEAVILDDIRSQDPDAHVNYMLATGRLQVFSSTLTTEKILSILQKRFLNGVFVLDADDQSASPQQKSFVDIISLLLFGTVLWCINLWGGLPAVTVVLGQYIWLLIGWVVFLSMMIYAGSIYATAYHDLRRGVCSMAVLVAVSTLVAWGLSMIICLWPSLCLPFVHHLYFDATLLTLAATRCSDYLRHRLCQRVVQPHHYLLPLPLPEDCTYDDDAAAAIWCLNKLCPVDGHLVLNDPSSSVLIDERWRTGGCRRVFNGGHVYAGSRFADDPSAYYNRQLKVTPSRLPGPSYEDYRKSLLVLPSASSTASSMVWLPLLIFFVALGAALCWYVWCGSVVTAVGAFLASLVVSCPCCLSLASPLALQAISASLPEIPLRNPEVLAELARIQTVAFDLTGTLTELRISEIQCNNDHAMALVCRLESECPDHPYAKALLRGQDPSQFAGLELTEFKYCPGGGLSGCVDQQKVVIGSQAFLEKQGILISPLAGLEEDGTLKLYVGVDNVCVGRIALQQTCKPGVSELIETLQSTYGKKEVYLMTGQDDTASLRAIAKELKISHVHSQCLPQQKQQLLTGLKHSVFVGDGPNDFAAFSSERVVGVRLESPPTTLVTDVAIADVTHLPRLLYAAQQAERLATQNRIIALTLAAVSLAFATGLLYPWTGLLLSPAFAPWLMPLALLCMLANTWRGQRQAASHQQTGDIASPLLPCQPVVACFQRMCQSFQCCLAPCLNPSLRRR